VIRIKAPQSGETIIHDEVQGDVRFANEVLDDFILLRSDGTPTFCTIPHRPSAMHWFAPASTSGTGTGGSLWMKDRISPSAKTTQRLDTFSGAVDCSESSPSSSTGTSSMRARMSSNAPDDTAQRSFFTDSSTWPSGDIRTAIELSAPT